MKAIISGGGTGGHIYPALAVARALQQKGWDILYLGSKGGLEGEIIPQEGIDYQEVNVAPLVRKVSPKLLSAVVKTSAGLLQSLIKIKKFKADIVLGTGGFVAGPVVLAASLLKIPTIIHEQNVYPGITNKLLAKRVNIIALNFADAKKYFPQKTKAEYVLVGNPIRQVILNTSRIQGIKELDLNPDKKTILVFGGSQGASSINNAMLEAYKYFSRKDNLQIIHITGKKNYQEIKNKLSQARINIDKNDNYKIVPYISKMEYAYAAADLVIYRAGATGIAEITAKGLPSILIPYPYAAENHQEYNARVLHEKQASLMILDKDLSGELLIENIENLLNHPQRLKRMAAESKKLAKVDATGKLVKVIEDIVS